MDAARRAANGARLQYRFALLRKLLTPFLSRPGVSASGDCGATVHHRQQRAENRFNSLPYNDIYIQVGHAGLPVVQVFTCSDDAYCDMSCRQAAGVVQRTTDPPGRSRVLRPSPHCLQGPVSGYDTARGPAEGRREMSDGTARSGDLVQAPKDHLPAMTDASRPCTAPIARNCRRIELPASIWTFREIIIA